MMQKIMDTVIEIGVNMILAFPYVSVLVGYLMVTTLKNRKKKKKK